MAYVRRNQITRNGSKFTHTAVLFKCSEVYISIFVIWQKDAILKYSIRELFLGWYWIYSLKKHEIKLALVLVIWIYRNCALFEIFRFGYNRFLPRVDTKRVLKATGSAVCILRSENISFIRQCQMSEGKTTWYDNMKNLNDSHCHRWKIHLRECGIWKKLFCGSHIHPLPDNNYC